MRPRTPGAGRAGFTVAEALTAVVVLATIVRMAFPQIQAALLRWRAEDVVEAVETVRSAARRFASERARWPADGDAGQVPAELVAYLPRGFRFEGAGYRLDWERWSLPDGLPGEPSTHGLVGVSVVTPDVALGRAVTRLLAGRTSSWELDESHTLLFATLP